MRIFKIGFLALVVFLGGCDELSYKLAHRGRDYPSMSGWYREISESLSICNQIPKRTVSVDGEVRGCGLMGGLQYNLQEYSGSKINADVYGSCRFKNRTLIPKCEIRNGQAKITQLYEGSYRAISDLCMWQLIKSRVNENRIGIRFVPLDYGFEEKDKAKTDRYAIEFAVNWGVFDAERSNIKFNSFSIRGHEYERLICTVENNQIVDVKRSELMNLSNDQKARLNYLKFYK